MLFNMGLRKVLIKKIRIKFSIKTSYTRHKSTLHIFIRTHIAQRKLLFHIKLLIFTRTIYCDILSNMISVLFSVFFIFSMGGLKKTTLKNERNLRMYHKDCFCRFLMLSLLCVAQWL